MKMYISHNKKPKYLAFSKAMLTGLDTVEGPNHYSPTPGFACAFAAMQLKILTVHKVS